MDEFKTLEDHIKARLQELYVTRGIHGTIPQGTVSAIFANGQIEALEWVLKEIREM